MKKAFLFFVIMLLFCDAHTVHAKRVVSLENGSLIIKEVSEVEVERIPNVPEGLTELEADKLVTGKMPEKVIERKNEDGMYRYSFDFPWLKTERFDRVASYRNGEWSVENFPGRFEEETEKDQTVLFIWVPMICIAGLILLSKWKSDGRLIVFFLMMFAGIPLSFFLNGFVIVFVAFIAGVTATLYLAETEHLAIFGGFASACISLFASFLMTTKNYEMVLHYCVLILAVEIVCYPFAEITGSARKQRIVKTE